MTSKPTVSKQKLLGIYTDLVKKNGRVPTDQELLEAGVPRGRFRHHFGSFTGYDRAARQYRPKVFDFTPVEEARGAKIPHRKRYLITNAVAGHELDEGALAAIANWTGITRGQFLFTATEDPASKAGKRRDRRQGYHPIDNKLLAVGKLVGEDAFLTDALKVCTIKMSAKHIYPLRGAKRLAEKGTSVIIGSPKQMLEMVPASGRHPAALMTTGCITKPNYTTDLFWSQRTAYLAERDHTMGAIVVETAGKNKFHFRQVQFDEVGGFIDLGIYYPPKGKPKPVKAEAIVFGDLHVGHETSNHWSTRYELLEFFRPKTIVVHDAFDGASITHHDKGRFITRSARPTTILESELNLVRQELDALSAFGKVVVVKSNHDETLDKYLDSCRWVGEPQNFQPAICMAAYMVSERARDFYSQPDPLAWWCKLDPEKVVFLERDEGFKVAGIECGAHGDKGPNGGTASPTNLESSYGTCVTGHTHSACIMRGVYTVGTSTQMWMGYNVGPSSWTNTHCVVYPGGHRQLITVLNDTEWRREG